MVNNYSLEVKYTYNYFDADEHIKITLYVETKKHLKPIGTWSYSTFTPIGNILAQKKIKKLINEYKPKFI